MTHDRMLEEVYQGSSLAYMSMLQDESVLQAILPESLNLRDEEYALEEWRYFLEYSMRTPCIAVHSILEAKICLKHYTLGCIDKEIKRIEGYGEGSIK